MGRQEEYRAAWEARADRDAYLMEQSGLPGPRANLELAQFAAERCDEATVRRYLEMGLDRTVANSPREYLVFVGVLGVGVNVADRQPERVEELRQWANDPRWRIREGVAMALQRIGDVQPQRLAQIARNWVEGTLLEQRAAVAGVAEPRLLRSTDATLAALDILDRATESLLHAPDRRAADFIALRKALGYAWSVVVVALPIEGRARFERWAQNLNADLRWVMRENLGKARLARMDAAWVEQMRGIVG